MVCVLIGVVIIASAKLFICLRKKHCSEKGILRVFNQLILSHYIVTVNHYILAVNHYILAVNHYIVTANHYLLAVNHYIVAVNHYFVAVNHYIVAVNQIIVNDDFSEKLTKHTH